MQRILFIQPKLEGVGGIEKVLPLIISGLAQKGCHVSTATFFGVKSYLVSNSYLADEEIGGTILKKISRLYKRILWIVKIVNLDKPSIIVVSAHGASVIVLTLTLLKIIKVPVVVYEHQSINVNDFGYKNLRLWLYKKASAFVAVSHGLHQELKSLFPNKIVETIYNPVIACGQSNSVEKGEPVFVTASRLEYVKGVDLLVDLFIKYKNNGGKGELHVYGEGSLNDSLIYKAKIEDCKDIKFKGVTNNICDSLKGATAYISCARHEALGVSLIEAISAGVPLVALDSPYGPREILRVDYNEKLNYPHYAEAGILFGSLKESSSLASNFFTALNYVIQNKYNFIEPALKRSTDFTPEVSVEKFLNLITKL